eukprot:3219204-Pyramimonas_sp.AAC.1
MFPLLRLGNRRVIIGELYLRSYESDACRDLPPCQPCRLADQAMRSHPRTSSRVKKVTGCHGC